MPLISGIHHFAIICSDFLKSKEFYLNLPGTKVISENFRTERNSMKCDISINGQYTIELFTFGSSPARLTYPEACGLRHIAFSTENIDGLKDYFNENKIKTESIRIDESNGKRFFFISDPDGTPIEFYES